MAGLYIHVPFCAKRCLYCDFFSNTEMKYKEPYINALIKEMELRKGYIGNEALETIYFGGGTPSQLDEKDFGKIFEAIYRHFDVAEQMEITLEANPDDMKREYVSLLRNYPFNRVSMGVQSFHPEDLRFLNRRHDREQAIKAVELCKEYGITNISIDLIYGLPNQTQQAWEENLRQAIRLDVPHLSAYHLIYEEGTALYKLLEAGKVTPINEELSVSFFSTLIDRLAEAGYLHYEISNFARPGFFSKHNSSYWTGKKYLGGARPACMQMFVREFAATQILLRTNYRSHQDIVEASLLVINENLDRFPKILEASELNQRKEETYRGTACRVRIKEFRDAPEQMQYLLHRLKGRSTQETCAILFRTNLAMQSVAARLGREGIPYVMKEKTRNIYEHFIVQDIMSYLRIAAGTAERIDFLRVINKPFRNISREAFGKHVSLQALEDYYSMKNNDYSADCNRKAC